MIIRSVYVIFGLFCISAPLVLLGNGSYNLPDPLEELILVETDTIPLKDRKGDYINDKSKNPFDLKDPDVVKKEVVYDPETDRYIIYEKVGDDYFRYPTYMTFEEYLAWRSKKQEEAYFNSLSGVHNDFMTFDSRTDPIEQFELKNENIVERLFGGTGIEIIPKGNIDITLGGFYQNIQNPNLPIRQQTQSGFDFDMDIQMSVTGKIGEKMSLTTNYNTNATFDYENQLKLKFDSETFSEDDIIKTIEAGNVSLPLRSSLIQGSQDLFGFKTDLQFGNLRLTALISQQKSKRENITLQGGAQLHEYNIYADEYDQNRHFLLSQYNRDVFEDALTDLPQLNSLFRVTRVEVWVTSVSNEFRNLREIVAFSDLAEYEVFNSEITEENCKLPSVPPELWDKYHEHVIPDNNSNRLYRKLVNDSLFTRELNTVVPTIQGMPYQMVAGTDFEQRRARKLDPNRYTLIPELGVLSLDVALRPDEILAVAYEYTYNGNNYQVGEFSADIPAFTGDSINPRNTVLFTKLLKSSTQNVSQPMWDLMMKNFYNIGAYQASEEDFQFDIYYDDPAAGQKRFLPEEGFDEPLLSVFNLDNLNYFGDPVPDGFFDFLPGITINTRTGKVMFPVLEPFGDRLFEYFDGDLQLYNKYEYKDLYDTSITIAREYQEKNRFILKGSFKSAISSEISLGAFNIPEGSVTVRSGGTTLIENQDYIVDYQIGRVRIINDAYLNSGAPINVSFEDRTLFSFNTRSMLGLRADYDLNDNMQLGGTFLQLWERPYSNKVNAGDDPINNKILGLDYSYSDDAPWLTKFVDAIPGIETKQASSVDLYVEGATLIPGHNKAIDVNDDKGGVVYLDDFDGSTSRYDLKTPTNNWALASIPQGSTEFPEAELNDDRLTGANRALLNWYRIERNLPGANDDPYTRFIPQEEIFPNKPIVPNLYDFRTFDLTYYPDERGPYNFDPPEGSIYSAGLEQKDDEVKLKDPKSRWGGIMRALPINDFEQANYESIEFWLLNPFIGERDQDGGTLYINLGTVSEDIQKDGLTFYENGLPIQGDVIPMDTSQLSRVAVVPPVINAFSNNEDDRDLQDLGFDGFNNPGEAGWYQEWIDKIVNTFPPIIIQDILADPSNDDYVWFDDDIYDQTGATVLERYKKYNNPEGNSPFTQNDASQRISNSYTSYPDQEDLNKDGSSEKTESYFEYEIPVKSNGKNAMVSTPYIIDTVNNPDGNIWYKFRVPIGLYTRKVGAINDFRSIRFIRMYMNGFESVVTLRFATFDLARNAWRKVTRLYENLPPSPLPPSQSIFEIGDVNLDEDAAKTPFGYITPPGIEREVNYVSSFRNDLLNEAALQLISCNMNIGHSNSVYKTFGDFDMRVYKQLKMFVHAESLQELDNGDISLFVRIGSDYTNNYYEYEMPLKMSQQDEIGTKDYNLVVWPEDNNLDITLQDLVNTKISRNDQGFPINDIYQQQDPLYSDRTIKVKGNPNLGMARNILIGVRNTSTKSEFCMEVWVNELRLVGLDNEGGSAGLARLDMQMADFGNLAVSGNFSTVGWGALHDKVEQRSREKNTQYDFATNLELGKFFGEESGIKLPFFAQYSNTKSRPKFDPYDLDIELDQKIDMADTKAERDSIRKQALDKTVIKSVSLTNVRKERKNSQKKPMPWDISNFSASYAFNKIEHSDPILKSDDSKHHSGSLDYRYSIGSGKYIEPLKNVIKSDTWLKWLKDFNFNPLPNTFTFRTSMDKRVRTRQFRFASDAFQQSVSRQWLWQRNYDLGWNFARSLKFNYTAVNNSFVDELDQYGNDWVNDEFVGNENRGKYAWDNVKSLGRTKSFNQILGLSYKIPLDKFVFLDWMTADLKLDADYTWTAAPVNGQKFGNSIANGRRENFRMNVNFDQLYAKSGYLNRIQGGSSSKNRQPSRSKSSTSRVDPDEEPDRKKKEKTGEISAIPKTFFRLLMLIRKGRFNYNRTYSTFVPGLKFTPSIVGMSPGFNEPGLDFILGSQPSDSWLDERANERGWFVDDVCVYQDVVRDYSERWDAEISIEPFADFRIDLTMDKEFRSSSNVLFKNNELTDPFWDFGKESQFGSYRISYYNAQTLFKDGEDQINELFDQFKSNLSVISQRLNPGGSAHPRFGPDYTEGYGPTQQEVVVPAFLAAYSNKDANEEKLNILDVFPKPNWRLTYNGLTKLNWFKDVFARISISHGYNSSMVVNTYNTDLRYTEDENGNSQIGENLDSISFDYYSRYTIPAIVVQEAFSPLIRIDVSTKNNMTFNFEMKKARTLALNPTGQELNETRSTDITAGFGYTVKGVSLFQGNKKSRKDRRGRNTRDPDQPPDVPQNTQSNDLRITFDFSIRDDRTVQHRWGIDIKARDARGQKAIRMNPAVEYDINKNMSLRFFIDYYKTLPYSSQTYPITNVNSGIKFRFTFN